MTRHDRNATTPCYYIIHRNQFPDLYIGHTIYLLKVPIGTCNLQLISPYGHQGVSTPVVTVHCDTLQYAASGFGTAVQVWVPLYLFRIPYFVRKSACHSWRLACDGRTLSALARLDHTATGTDWHWRTGELETGYLLATGYCGRDLQSPRCCCSTADPENRHFPSINHGQLEPTLNRFRKSCLAPFSPTRCWRLASSQPSPLSAYLPICHPPRQSVQKLPLR